MKIVIINGSARKGNTLTAINAFIKGASEKNEIEIIEPDKLNIAPCKGCGVCQCSKGCVDKDDTNPTIDKIAAADMILFATPVYWWGMSAQLKLIIDKCYCSGLQLKNKKDGTKTPGEWHIPGKYYIHCTWGWGGHRNGWFNPQLINKNEGKQDLRSDHPQGEYYDLWTYFIWL